MLCIDADGMGGYGGVVTQWQLVSRICPGFPAQDITGAMWDSWGRGDLDLLKSMGVNTFLGEIGESR